MSATRRTILRGLLGLAAAAALPVGAAFGHRRSDPLAGMDLEAHRLREAAAFREAYAQQVASEVFYGGQVVEVPPDAPLSSTWLVAWGEQRPYRKGDRIVIDGRLWEFTKDGVARPVV